MNRFIQAVTLFSLDQFELRCGSTVNCPLSSTADTNLFSMPLHVYKSYLRLTELLISLWFHLYVVVWFLTTFLNNYLSSDCERKSESFHYLLQQVNSSVLMSLLWISAGFILVGNASIVGVALYISYSVGKEWL